MCYIVHNQKTLEVKKMRKLVIILLFVMISTNLLNGFTWWPLVDSENTIIGVIGLEEGNFAILYIDGYTLLDKVEAQQGDELINHYLLAQGWEVVSQPWTDSESRLYIPLVRTVPRPLIEVGQNPLIEVVGDYFSDELQLVIHSSDMSDASVMESLNEYWVEGWQLTRTTAQEQGFVLQLRRITPLGNNKPRIIGSPTDDDVLIIRTSVTSITSNYDTHQIINYYLYNGWNIVGVYEQERDTSISRRFNEDRSNEINIVLKRASAKASVPTESMNLRYRVIQLSTLEPDNENIDMSDLAHALMSGWKIVTINGYYVVLTR